MPVSFGVALWERYNRLILRHSAGMAALVTRFDDLVKDARGWSGQTREFLAGLGMDLAPMPNGSEPGEDVVDAGLRHAEHSRADLVEAGATVLALYDALEAVVGPTASFVAPELGPEPPSVAAELDTVGPATELAWHPPPWAPGRAAGPAGGAEAGPEQGSQPGHDR